MIKVVATNAVVSKGYDNSPALKFGEKGDSVRFRIGKKLYDPKAKDNARWMNISVKAFGAICERIKKMKLNEGSYINFTGRLDEDVWTDTDTGEVKKAMVIVLDDVEYAGGGKKDQKKEEDASAQGGEASPEAQAPEASGNFTGFQPYDGGSFFDS